MAERTEDVVEIIETELDAVQLMALALPTDEHGHVGFNPYDTGAFGALAVPKSAVRRPQLSGKPSR